MGRRRRVSYEQRRCPSCPDCIEDEMHAIFHCTNILQRLIYSDLFESGNDVDSLRSFLASNPPHRVANFLIDCRNVAMLGQPDGNMISTSDDYSDDYDST